MYLKSVDSDFYKRTGKPKLVSIKILETVKGKSEKLPIVYHKCIRCDDGLLVFLHTTNNDIIYEIDERLYIEVEESEFTLFESLKRFNKTISE